MWRAWHRLTHDRPWISGGMGGSTPGRLPWSLLRDWADHHGLDAEQFELLDVGVAAMDAVYLSHMREVAKRAAPPK